MNIYVFGAGKVGTALTKAWRAAGHHVVLRKARQGLPKKPIVADALVLTVRDRELGATAEAFGALVPKACIALHCAGSQTAEALASLRPFTRGVAQMHPMIGFSSVHYAPTLLGGHCHVKGDAPAERIARILARAAGLMPRTFDDLDVVAYHAAAGLVANGAAALAAMGAELLRVAGVPANVTSAMLGPLLRSVADNVQKLGLPAALSGPVRRGDAAAVERHDQLVTAKLPRARALYLAACAAQIPMARVLGENTPAAFDAIETYVQSASNQLAKGAIPRPSTPARNGASSPTPPARKSGATGIHSRPSLRKK